MFGGLLTVWLCLSACCRSSDVCERTLSHRDAPVSCHLRLFRKDLPYCSSCSGSTISGHTGRTAGICIALPVEMRFSPSGNFFIFGYYLVPFLILFSTPLTMGMCPMVLSAFPSSLCLLYALALDNGLVVLNC